MSMLFGHKLYADNYGLDITNNHLALIYAVISTEYIRSDDAMEIFGVKPEIKEVYKNSKYKTIGQMVYMLDVICEVPRTEIAKALNISVETLRNSLHHIGAFKDRRFRE